MRHACARALVVILSACSTAPVSTPDVPAVLVGQPAPDFTIANLDGARDSVSLVSLRGDVVLLYFWATRCEACKVEIPHLEAMYERLKREGFAVVALSQDEPDSNDSVGPFLRARGTTFPAGWDRGHLVAQAYRPGDFPTTYLIDRKGQVRFQHIGHLPGDERKLEREVDLLLMEKPTATAQRHLASPATSQSTERASPFSIAPS